LSQDFEPKKRKLYESEVVMNKNDCQKESISNKTVGIVVIAVSLLLLVVGLVVLPVVGFIFAAPLLVFGVALIMAPESKACRLIMDGLRGK
jgi:hypothetical protein